MKTSISENLRNARENANLKQVEVSRKASFNNKSISNWENGVSLPCLEDAIKLADLYNVSLDVLVGRNYRSQNRISLTLEEITLITNYRQLNSIGKQKAEDYINDLIGNPTYTQKEKTIYPISA